MFHVIEFTVANELRKPEAIHTFCDKYLYAEKFTYACPIGQLCAVCQKVWRQTKHEIVQFVFDDEEETMEEKPVTEEKKLNRYEIAGDTDINALQETVQSMINCGWTPQGGVCVMAGHYKDRDNYLNYQVSYYQAMVKSE